MSDYDSIVKGKLILKGEKRKPKKHKAHKNSKDKEKKLKVEKIDEDSLKRGGWWAAKCVTDIIGTVAIEFGDRSYLKALDNGLFTLGVKHTEGENGGPDPEEIFTAFPINDTKVSFKSGYNKYLKVEKDGVVTGRSEAVGSMEQWEPIFEDGRMALLSEIGFFMSIDPEDDACVALRKKVSEHEVCTVRCNAVRITSDDDELPKEEKGDLTEVEKNYVKKFQKFQDKKLRINRSDIKELEEAKEQGQLHEALLNRRSKMKADRYCK